MKRDSIVRNSFLWAMAIIASAILDAPNSVTLILLPCLAMASLLSSLPEQKKVSCRRNPDCRTWEKQD